MGRKESNQTNKQKQNEGVSISNQPDHFLTDLHNQDLHSLFGHQNKTYVHNLSNIGLLVDNVSHFQALSVSQMIIFVGIRLLCEFYSLINNFSMKNEMCSTSTGSLSPKWWC